MPTAAMTWWSSEGVNGNGEGKGRGKRGKGKREGEGRGRGRGGPGEREGKGRGKGCAAASKHHVRLATLPGLTHCCTSPLFPLPLSHRQRDIVHSLTSLPERTQTLHPCNNPRFARTLPSLPYPLPPLPPPLRERDIVHSLTSLPERTQARLQTLMRVTEKATSVVSPAVDSDDFYKASHMQSIFYVRQGCREGWGGGVGGRAAVLGSKAHEGFWHITLPLPYSPLALPALNCFPSLPLPFPLPPVPPCHNQPLSSHPSHHIPLP